MACDCCNTPVCNAPSLVCEASNASKSKLIGGCTRAWDCATNSGTGSLTKEEPCSGGTTFSSGGANCIDRYLRQDVSLVGCAPCTGSMSFVVLIDPTTLAATLDSCSGSITCSGGTYGCGNINPGGCPPYSEPSGISHAATSTLSSIYTTDQLKAAAIAALTPYTGSAFSLTTCSFSGTSWPVCGNCASIADLSVDETSYTIRRVRYSLRFSPNASCYLKVWLRKRFRPSGTSGASDVLTDLTTYEWAPTPVDGFCLANPAVRPGDNLNRVTTAWLGEETEPATNGVTYVEIKKYSCVPGYEPSNPNNDGTRPSPDPLKNGHPYGFYT